MASRSFVQIRRLFVLRQQARVQELQGAVKEHDTVVARVAGAEAMANELRSTVEMLRELLKAAEERSGRAGTGPAPVRQPARRCRARMQSS